MNPHSENQTRSLWHEPTAHCLRGPLERDTAADVCVVGAGMAGLATAYELARQGRRVVVLDDGPIGGGETGRSTAHLASAIDDRFFKIEQIHGGAALRACYESHKAAIDWIDAAVATEEISCDLLRVNGYLFTPPGEDESLLYRELAAACRAGFTEAEVLPRAPLPAFDTGTCLRFPNQGQFNPMAFLAGLVPAIERLGGRIYCDAHVREIDDERQLVVRCENRPSVYADAVVIATNSPINDVVTLHTKQHAYRTYAVALPIQPDAVEPALYWDTSQTAGDLDGPYHYARLQMNSLNGGPGGRQEMLIVGGEDHKTGQADDAPRRWERLAAWAHDRFPVIGPAQFTWSGQVMEPVDHVAFIGPNPTGPENIYVVTGDSGMGITHGAIAAMLLGDLIAGRQNPWAQLYDPARRTLRTAVSYARENFNVAAQYSDWLRPGDVHSTSEIAPGCGATVRQGFRLLACYRDATGALHVRNAACPHLGGVVHWNSAEHTWDCPCHGSRFNADGEVINGPAITPLQPVNGAGGGTLNEKVIPVSSSAATVTE